MCRKLNTDMDSEARSAEMENYTEELRAIKLWGPRVLLAVAVCWL